MGQTLGVLAKSCKFSKEYQSNSFCYPKCHGLLHFHEEHAGLGFKGLTWALSLKIIRFAYTENMNTAVSPFRRFQQALESPELVGEGESWGGGGRMGWTSALWELQRADFRTNMTSFHHNLFLSITHVFLLYYLELRPSKSTICPQILHFTNIIQLPPLLSNHTLFPNLDYLILALVLLHCEVRKTVSGRT